MPEGDLKQGGKIELGFDEPSDVASFEEESRKFLSTIDMPFEEMDDRMQEYISLKFREYMRNKDELALILNEIGQEKLHEIYKELDSYAQSVAYAGKHGDLEALKDAREEAETFLLEQTEAMNAAAKILVDKTKLFLKMWDSWDPITRLEYVEDYHGLASKIKTIGIN